MLRSSKIKVALVAALASGPGCADPSIGIELQVPEGYRDPVTDVSLQLLVPPPGDSFGCEDLALARVAAATVTLSLVQESVSALGDSVALGGIPREPRKLIYARGLDAQGSAVVAACAEVGEITDDLTVTLVGEPTAVVDLPSSALGSPLPARIPVAVSDSRGQPLADREVQWSVIGPGDEVLSGQTRTSIAGVAELQPEPPALPGPAALEVSVRWPRVPVPALLGFHQPAVMFAGELPGAIGELRVDTVYRVGRVGPAGEPGLVALAPLDGVSRRLYLAWHDPAAPASFRSVISAEVPGVISLGLLRRNGRDVPVVINGSAWLELDSDGTFTAAPAPRPGATARQIESIGPCEPAPVPAAILVAFDDETVVAYGPDRQVIESPFAASAPSARLSASGCVSASDGLAHRVVLYTLGPGRQAVATDIGGLRTTVWNTFGSGLGFAPAMSGAPALLLGSEVGLEGTTLVRYRLLTSGPDVELEEIARNDTATAVLSVAGGDLDADGDLDLAALLFFGELDGQTETRMQLVLGVEHSAGALVGLSGTTQGVGPRVWLADFDGDGHDDVLLGDAERFTIYRMGPS